MNDAHKHTWIVYCIVILAWIAVFSYGSADIIIMTMTIMIARIYTQPFDYCIWDEERNKIYICICMYVVLVYWFPQFSSFHQTYVYWGKGSGAASTNIVIKPCDVFELHAHIYILPAKSSSCARLFVCLFSLWPMSMIEIWEPCTWPAKSGPCYIGMFFPQEM